MALLSQYTKKKKGTQGQKVPAFVKRQVKSYLNVEKISKTFFNFEISETMRDRSAYVHLKINELQINNISPSSFAAPIDSFHSFFDSFAICGRWPEIP